MPIFSDSTLLLWCTGVISQLAIRTSSSLTASNINESLQWKNLRFVGWSHCHPYFAKKRGTTVDNREPSTQLHACHVLILGLRDVGIVFHKAKNYLWCAEVLWSSNPKDVPCIIRCHSAVIPHDQNSFQRWPGPTKMVNLHFSSN